MTAAHRRIFVVAVAWGLGLAAAAILPAQPPGSIPPVYSQRLRVPVRGDELAQPRAVVADLHTLYGTGPGAGRSGGQRSDTCAAGERDRGSG